MTLTESQRESRFDELRNEYFKSHAYIRTSYSMRYIQFDIIKIEFHLLGMVIDFDLWYWQSLIGANDVEHSILMHVLIYTQPKWTRRAEKWNVHVLYFYCLARVFVCMTKDVSILVEVNSFAANQPISKRAFLLTTIDCIRTYVCVDIKNQTKFKVSREGTNRKRQYQPCRYQYEQKTSNFIWSMPCSLPFSLVLQLFIEHLCDLWLFWIVNILNMMSNK